MDEELTLLLIDGMNVIRRVYEANDEDTPEKKTVVALRSAFASIRNILKESPHTHALLAIDHGGDTWRHRLYSQYKENRGPMPTELRAAIPAFLKKLKDELGLFSLSIPDVEADDVIATCVRKWTEDERGEVIVVSTDKDLTWLIAHGAKIRNYFDKSWRTDEWCMQKFGVHCGQMLDFLALMGDKVDGIPGLKGCGPKTAAKWLAQYGNLQGIYDNLDKIEGKIGQTLRDNIEDVKLSRKLTLLHSSVKCGIKWGDLRR